MTDSDTLNDEILLGKATSYNFDYDASLLFPIPRADGRKALGIDNQSLPFFGVDRWTAYELSWLTRTGLPRVAIAQFDFCSDSSHIIESKSFKLYLNSFNQTVIHSDESLIDMLQHDLASACGGSVKVSLHAVDAYAIHEDKDFLCLDELPVNCRQYTPDASLLRMADVDASPCEGQWKLKSHLLRSLCPVTGQPDWATIYIHYSGREICQQSLLQYIVSYRNHQGFHEQCVEQIYRDLQHFLAPLKLMVYARYTRRGGLDINPLRCSTNGECFDDLAVRTARQ